MPDFNLERILGDMQQGSIRGFEARLDPAHDAKPNHIDLHVLRHDGPGVKYTNLGGVERLREQLPWLQPGQSITERTFGFGGSSSSGGLGGLGGGGSF